MSIKRVVNVTVAAAAVGIVTVIVMSNPHNDALGGTFPWLKNKCN